MNEKLLSIVIPSYNESELQIYPLLSSIACQTGVNFGAIEVLIVKDGGGHVYGQDFLRLFPVEIYEYTMQDNVGPGLVRQAGLELARGLYVMFCDADDSLYTVTALEGLLNTAIAEKPDILRSSWYEQAVEGDAPAQYILKQGENTWLHGKLFRRQFLLANDIKFHDDLRVHEDTYFLALAAAHTEKYLSIPTITYLWRHNPDSITRGNDHEYQYKSFPEFVKASGLAHTALYARGVGLAAMCYKVVQVTCYVYFMMHTAKWQGEQSAPYREAVEKSFSKWHEPTWEWFLEADRGLVLQIYNEERSKNFPGEIETETLPQWLKRIGMPCPGWMTK